MSVSGTQGATQYFLSGLAKYDNGTLLNTGYNKQSIRSNVTQQFANGLSATANLFYAHSTRRGISGNDNNGISPYDVFSYTPQIRESEPPESRRLVGQQLLRERESVCRRVRHRDAGDHPAIRRRRQHQLDSLTARNTRSLQINVLGGADIAHVRDDLFAPSNLQFEQAQALPGVSTTQKSDNQYLNYSINLIHHYTGLSWLDATTSAGFVRERRDLVNPETVSQNLLAGVNNPSTGTVQTNFYNRTAARPVAVCTGADPDARLAARPHRTVSLPSGRPTTATSTVLRVSAVFGLVSHPAVRRLPG